MQKVTSIFLFFVTLLAVFKTATPFLSYKANYTFIVEEMCVYRGTTQQDDCDGFCYLKKNIEDQNGGSHDSHNSKKAVHTYQNSSLFGILESGIYIYSPFHNIERSSLDDISAASVLFLEVLSPPPKA